MLNELDCLCFTSADNIDHFSECVESHAFSTYDKFIKEQGGKNSNHDTPQLDEYKYLFGQTHVKSGSGQPIWMHFEFHLA